MNLSGLKGLDNAMGGVLIYLLTPLAIFVNFITGRATPLNNNNICVMKLLGGGSLLIAYPSLLGLRDAQQHKKLILICTKEVKVYADLMFLFDEIVVIEFDSIISIILTAFRALRKSFSSAIFLNLEMHSKLCTIFSLLTCSKDRFGLFQSWNRWQKKYINNPVFYNSHTPIYVGYEQVCRSIGALIPAWERACITFRLRNSFRNKVKSFNSAPVVAFAPFCSQLYKERQFSRAEWLIVLSKHINCKNTTIMIYGGVSDVAESILLEDAIKKSFEFCIVKNMTGKTKLSDLVDEFGFITQMITIDSGINHLGRLLGVPIVSYWGPSDRVEISPIWKVQN